jgi:hypothetical protein
MSSLCGPTMAGTAPERRDDVGGVVDRQRGLRDEGELVGVAHLERRDVLDGFDQQHLALGQLAHGADGLGVAGMADHDHLQAVLVVPLGLDMDLADQRAGGVDKSISRRAASAGTALGTPWAEKITGRSSGHSSSSSTKTAPLARRSVDHEAVVHDLVAHIDGRAPFLERHLDDLDRAVDAGAEAARRGEVEGQGRFGSNLSRCAAAAQ